MHSKKTLKNLNVAALVVGLIALALLVAALVQARTEEPVQASPVVEVEKEIVVHPACLSALGLAHEAMEFQGDRDSDAYRTLVKQFRSERRLCDGVAEDDGLSPLPLRPLPQDDSLQNV